MAPFFGSWEVESRQRFLLRRHSGDAIKNPAAAGCLDSLICDKNRVGHRTVVTLSFARA